MLPVKEGVYWAKRINDQLAEAAQKLPRAGSTPAASLAFQAPDEAAKELERAYKDLGAKCNPALSNINGEPLFLSKFDPLFSMWNEVGDAGPAAPDGPVDVRTSLNMLPHPVPAVRLHVRHVRLDDQPESSTACSRSHPNLKMIHGAISGDRGAPYLVQRLRAFLEGIPQGVGPRAQRGAGHHLTPSRSGRNTTLVLTNRHEVRARVGRVRGT